MNSLSANAVPNIDAHTSSTDIANQTKESATLENAAGVASLFGTYGGLIAAGINLSTQATATAEQSSQYSEGANAAQQVPADLGLLLAGLS